MSDIGNTRSSRDSSSSSYRREPFERGEGRVMVSLGPLHPRRYCTYQCPFCYVQAEYGSFEKLSNDDIVRWVEQQDQSTFDTIYVSGDTDSFAPPRLREGVDLLEKLADLDKDLLFTTRAPFDSDALDRVVRFNDQLRRRNHWLFGCVSIAQFTMPHLEPRPVPEPLMRIQQLAAFHERGLVSVLALRPFLPNVPLSDYTTILDLSSASVDIVLGEDWYADTQGKLESAVFQGPPPASLPVAMGQMPFDSNTADWRVYHLPEHEALVEGECKRRGLPFFMRSEPALRFWRESHL